MHYYEIVPAKIFRSNSDILTYQYPEKLPLGTLVLIPLGKQTIPGLILKSAPKPIFPTKPISKILYSTPLPRHLVQSLLWLRDYYATPLPTILQTALPKGLRKNRRSTPVIPKNPKETPKTIPLTPAQQKALTEVLSTPSNTALLHGITGSGKTNIYLELARQTLNQNRSVILLVPEIALTSQLVQNFSNHFNNVTLLHSQQTEAKRHLAWEQILNSTTPQIIIGPRSALFAPLQNLGLIIIDEAHEPAYHQDQSPKYSATKLASVITSVVNSTTPSKTPPKPCLTLLGTATPTITDYYLAKQQNALITLSELAVKSDKSTQTTLIDLKNPTLFKKHRLFSDPLLVSITKSLANHTQTIIFHNRRGSAPLTICDHCGWQALCPRCLLPLTLHTDQFQLLCHTCGHHTPVPTNCPTCRHADLIHKGFGTKFLETELRKLFPSAKIARFDMDTGADQSLHTTYDQIKNNQIDLIIGTQMIAKGFDFPHLTTLGIIQADAGLSLPDFSSEERTFQLLTQVIGRANRGHQHSEIFVQTYQPDHPAIQHGINADYPGFYHHLIKHRQKTTFPPYSYLLKLSFTYKTESIAIKHTQSARQHILGLPAAKQLSISSPTPAFHEHTPQGYTWQLLVKSKKRQHLLDLLASLPPNPHLRFHLDPPSLI